MSDGHEALDVLRDVWQGRSQGAADLGDGRETAGCKRISEAGVGFDDYGGATEEDRVAAWRSRLEREGKLNPGVRGLRDRAAGTGAG